MRKKKDLREEIVKALEDDIRIVCPTSSNQYKSNSLKAKSKEDAMEKFTKDNIVDCYNLEIEEVPNG